MENARTKITNKFVKLLNNKNKAIKLEQEIFNFTHNLTKDLQENNPEILLTYLEKSRSIYENLNPKSYFDTVEGMKKKNIVTADIKSCRYKTLWKTIKQNQEILDKNLMDLKPTTETDQFLCKKCHNRKTTFYTMQIRSADEAETSFITCLVCNYSWREG